MALDDLLAPNAHLEKVASGFTWCEGPAWIPARGVLRFSDIPGNRVLEFSEADGTTVEVSTDAEFTNGRTLAADGAMIECSHGRRAVQIDRGASVAGAPYAPEILVDHFFRPRLNSPNDVVEKSDGTIWFTDPSYGIKRPVEGHAGQEEYGDRYVFRCGSGRRVADSRRHRHRGAERAGLLPGREHPVRLRFLARPGRREPPRIPTGPAATRSTPTTWSRAGTRRTAAPWWR